MKLIPHPELAKNILGKLQQEYFISKPMPHVTELIYCLTRSYYDRTDPLPATDTEILLFAIGWGLERVLLSHEIKQISKQVDGISYSPDFLAFTGYPGELKTTRMSSRDFEIRIPDTWKKQMLSYMHCEQTVLYEMPVLFICGNYKPPSPSMGAFRVEADIQEIEANWAWMLDRKSVYLECMHKQIIPPYQMFCEKWECEHCRYSCRCLGKPVGNVLATELNRATGVIEAQLQNKEVKEI